MVPLLKTIALRKEYSTGKNKTIAVRDVTLQINAGSSVAITGPSGCGKTTLINMIGLIIPPSSGKLMIESTDSTSFTEKQLAQYRNEFFGYVVQDFALVNHYSVYENIEIPLLYAKPQVRKRERKEKVEEVLSKVGLLEKLNEDITRLSGGQKQRVAVARALVNNPRIILADEPTGSLDSKTSEDIFDVLMGLVKEGKTLIMVTHNQDLAQKCDVEIKMLDGSIV